MQLSIVTCLYNSAAFIPEFYERAVKAASSQTENYELVFVDDGSGDNSSELVRAIIAQDAKVKLVELSRNFGHHHAALAGVMAAKGEIVFYLDVDLEDQPEWLDSFMQEMSRHQSDVVYAVKEERKGNFFRRWSGRLFYKLFNLFSDTKILANVCSACLMNRLFIEAMRSMREKNIFMIGAMTWVGFRTRVITVQRSVRSTPSNYTLWRSLNMAANAVTSFSAYPLHLIFLLGLALSLCFGGMGLYMLLKKIFFPDKVFFGYASLIVSIWFLGGVLILFIGVIGIYLAKIFTEVKGRPQYIVRKVYQNDKQPDGV